MKKTHIVCVLMALMLCLCASTALGARVLTLPQNVTAIEDEAFFGDTSLGEVILPDTITSIGARAFANSSLTEIDLPISVEAIGEGAFDGCEGMEIIADEGTYAYEWAVAAGLPVKDRPLADDWFTYTIEDGGAVITDYTGSAKNVIVPKLLYGYPVTKIGAEAFQNNKMITRVVLPEGLTEIGSSAFLHCEKMTSITIPSTVTSLGDRVLAHCYALESVEIPSGVTNIGDWAFASCTSLTEIEIPSGVTKIGLAAFQECSALAKIEIPAGLTEIGAQAFYECAALTDVRLPDSVKAIGAYAFASCGKLESVNIPYGVTAIEKWTFGVCSSLKEIEIPATVKSIGVGAFQQCTSLSSVVIPSSVESIANQAFYKCTGLTKAEIPAAVASIGSYAFSGCHDDLIIYGASGSAAQTYANKNDIYFVAQGEAVQSEYEYTEANGEATITAYTGSDTVIVIPEEIDGYPVTGIAEKAFEYNEDLVGVSLPASVKTIGEYAFRSCENLEKISMPSGVTVIGAHAFENCGALKSIRIPSGVTAIDEWTFAKCASLTSVSIPSGVTDIGLAAFQDCSKLVSVSIPSSVTSIGKQAFNRCAVLDNVVIPDSVTSIGNQAFYACSGLTSIRLPANLTAIADWTFGNCTGLEEIEIPSGVTTIGASAFQGSTALISITLPDSVTSVGKQAFYKCAGLESVKLSGAMTAIADWTFANCASLMEIDIPQNITSLGTAAFQGCTAIESVVLPEGMTSVGKQAFYKCAALTEIDIPQSVTEIGSLALSECHAELTIYGIIGSYAQTYAGENGFTFIPHVDFDDPIASAALVVGGVTHDPDSALSLAVGDHQGYTLQIAASDAWEGEGSPAVYVYSDNPDAVYAYMADELCAIYVKKAENATIYVSAVEADSLSDVPNSYRHQVCTVDTPTYRALVIGQTYEGNTQGIGELPICASDRDGMKGMLDSMDGTPYVTTAKGNLTKEQMESAIASAFSGADANDVSLLYYSGHGLYSSNSASLGALVGVDFNTMTVNDLKAALDRVPGRKIVILDSCHSGNFIGKNEDGLLGQTGAVSQEEMHAVLEAYNQSVISVFASKAKSLAASDYYVITAASSTEESFTGVPYSVFTNPVITGSGYGVSGGVMAADTDENGMIALDECYRYAYAQALNVTTQHAQVYPENSGFVIWAK